MENATNLWYELYSRNYHLLSDNVKRQSLNYLNHNVTLLVDDFVNFFNLDGSSDKVLKLVTNEFKLLKDNLVIPDNVDKNQKCLFINFAEGYSSKELFSSIHFLIELFGLNGYIEYRNCAANNQQMYNRFCLENNIDKKITICSFKNTAFLERKSYHYDLPNHDNVNFLTETEKKLYCCFNWNPWEHRLAMIGLLNHYNLISSGYVTSPGIDKFSYNNERDFDLLKNRCYEFFSSDVVLRDGILSSLEILKSNYPLKIDDRSQFTDTDTVLADKELKIPLYTARVNSFIEVVTETRFNGEHFFSEKTFWPVLIKKPFIMVGSVNSLDSFRKLGFKTFSPFINEDYDKIEDPIQRLLSISKQLKKLENLRSKNFNLFKTKLLEIQEILDYNYELFMEYQIA